MNTVVKAVLFCAFLTASLIPDVEANPAESSKFAAQLHHLTKRAATPVTCGCSNSSIPNVNVSLTVYVNGSLYSVVNLNANVAFVLSTNESIFALLNGNNGAAVVVNITANTGVYLANGVWRVANQSFQAYLRSLNGTLAPLLKKTGAVAFKVDTASSTILNAANQIVINLVSYIKVEIQVNPKYGLQLIIKLSKQLILLASTSFSGQLQILGSGVNISVDLAAEVIILNTLGKIIDLIPGGLGALLTPNNLIKFPSQSIALQTSGLGRFIIIFKAIASVNNAKIIIEALGSSLNNIKPLFNILNGLGGNINTGLAGLIKVLANLVAYLKGDTKLEVVIQVLIQFLAYNSPAQRQAITPVLNQNLTTLLDAIKTANATEALSGLVGIANATLNKTLIVEGVNISAVITLLTSNKNVLEILVGVVLQLKPVADSSTSVPTCLLVLLCNLNNPTGVELLKGLGIIINIGSGVISSGNIIGSLLGSVVNLVLLLLGNLFGALSQLPVIGNVVLALEGALSVGGGGGLSLKNLLNINGLISGLIKGLIQVCTGAPLGVGSSVVAQVKVLLSVVVSVSFSVEIL